MPSVITGVTSITVQDVLDWELPADVAKTSVRTSKTAIDPHETQLFSLEGDVWIAKRSPDDCDFHLEISKTDGTVTSRRIIVEIPSNDFFDVPRKVLQDKLAEMKAQHLLNSTATLNNRSG